MGIAAELSSRLSSGITTETSCEKQQRERERERERFESVRTSKTTLKHGSTIPPDGDASTWIAKSLDDPMPINIELKALTELLTEEVLGDTDIDVKKLKQKLKEFLTKYCSKLEDEEKAKDCTLPTGTNDFSESLSHYSPILLPPRLPTIRDENVPLIHFAECSN